MKIRVGGVPEHFNFPWHLGLESGAFAAARLDVTYTDYPGGTGALTRALAEGELDLAIVLTEGITAAILNGNPSKIVKNYVDSPLIWGIHTGQDSEVSSEADMQGRSYAISRFGSGSHLMAIVDAAQRGLRIEESQFVKVGNLEGAREALGKGEASLFLWEKFMTKPLVDKGEFRRIGETRTPWPCFMAAAPESVLHTHGEAIQLTLEIVTQRAFALMHDPEATQKIAERYELDLPDVENWFRQTYWSMDFEQPTPALTKVITSLNNLGVIDAPSAKPNDVWYYF